MPAGAFPRVNGVPAIPEGTGTAIAIPSGTLSISTTQLGTTAGTSEEVLWTYTLPANTLSADRKGVRVKVYATCANNANNKTLRAYFGGTTVLAAGPGAFQNQTLMIEWEVYRTGASAQTAAAFRMTSAGGFDLALTTPTDDTTAPIAIKFTGQDGSASANDIVFRIASVEAIN